MKLKIALPLAAAAAVVACGGANYAPTAYVPSQLEAICVDRYGVRVEPEHCTVGYGPVRDGFTWEYADTSGDFDLPYYGSRVPSGWSTQRPVNITTITIIQPTAQTTRPPGTRATSVKVPKATRAPVTTTRPAPTTAAKAKTDVQRGGLGVKTTTTKKRAN